MASFGRLLIWLICSFFAGSVAHASDPQDLGGFVLGDPLEAAQQHALQMGWQLVPRSDSLPGQWAVDGSSLSLFVCDGTIGSVGRQFEGDLEEFAARVFSMERQLGKPDIKILSFSSGVEDISTIDASFVMDNGGANVQLQSIDGKRTLSVNHWIDRDCE